MGRKSTKAEGTLIVLAIVIGLPIYLATKLLEVTGWVIPIVAIVLVIALVMLVKYAKKQ
ncbi:hypothetical protein [Oleiagrimonas sp. MCCC 1A03011]|uniref:hypothetical protein n=1 Tax=Oleiagrimonas sp. MCCC 1A03011 TaxID=1926883 RepID=UPI00143D4C95|nr:hypothetical protein [Oleiagrimonas sp. MCCC 1A03011]